MSSSQSYTKNKVFIVDDNPANTMMLRQVVEAEHFEFVYVYNDSELALKEFRQIKPQLVLLDLLMPKLTGIEFLQEIAQEVQNAEVAVIVLTASHDKKQRIQALELGAQDYIEKPINIIETLQRIKNVLHLQQHKNSFQDLSEDLDGRLKKTTQNLSEVIVTLNTIFDNSSEYVFVTDKNGNITDTNKVALKRFGLKADQDDNLFEHFDMDKQLFEGCETELVLQDINNKRIIVEVGYSQVVINELHHYIFIFKDITSRKEDEINLKFLAETHYITHLPNRNQAQSQIADKCQSVGADEKLSFIFISFVENNKVVEFYGHERLEYLLLNIALILVELAAINGSALIHWGDNDFLMVEKQSHTKELIDALLVRFDQSVQICDSTEVGIYARPTVGICDSSLLPGLVLQDYDTLVHNALLATFEGARLSRSVTYYDDQLHDKINYQAMIEKELVIAIQEESFRVAYQPKVDLSTGEIVAAEALIRWNHPQFGFIRPDIFIPVAESGGLIKDIGALVLTMVLNDISKIKNKYPGIHHVAINVAAPQLDSDFIVLLQSKLASHGKGISEFIELEITETSFLDDFDRVSLILQQIKQLGFRLALDDFGTGYSSLSYLHELPVDTLKIDRAFIIPILESKRSLLLVKSIISMSLSLGLEIVAEGIEDKKTGELLNEMGVQQGQGFYYYRPEFL